MRHLRLVPEKTNLQFIRHRNFAFAFSAALILASLALLVAQGLNFGIDFRGGTLIEIKTEGPADINDLRSRLSGLGLGDVTLQEFGAPDDVMIRVQQQEGDESAQMAAIERVRAELGPGVEYRRVEYVGPKVGQELIQAGIIAVVLAMGAILVYIWFRFEWQFGVCAVLALAHDVVATAGMFALTQIEFNLSTVAAILTIAGYSINDTVVIFDRVRENLRRYKSLPIAELLNRSINETLSRTTITSVTTLLALVALYLFGGEVIRGFSFAMIFGVVIGTYSSIWIAVPLLLWMGMRSTGTEAGAGGKTEQALP